jgi:hypothetical protein
MANRSETQFFTQQSKLARLLTRGDSARLQQFLSQLGYTANDIQLHLDDPAVRQNTLFWAQLTTDEYRRKYFTPKQRDRHRARGYIQDGLLDMVRKDVIPEDMLTRLDAEDHWVVYELIMYFGLEAKYFKDLPENYTFRDFLVVYRCHGYSRHPTCQLNPYAKLLGALEHSESWDAMEFDLTGLNSQQKDRLICAAIRANHRTYIERLLPHIQVKPYMVDIAVETFNLDMAKWLDTLVDSVPYAEILRDFNWPSIWNGEAGTFRELEVHYHEFDYHMDRADKAIQQRILDTLKWLETRFRETRKPDEPDIDYYYILVELTEHRLNRRAFKWLFRRMKILGLQPDYQKIIDKIAKRWESSDKSYQKYYGHRIDWVGKQMKKEDLIPDYSNILKNLLVGAFDDHQTILDVEATMISNGQTPDYRQLAVKMIVSGSLEAFKFIVRERLEPLCIEHDYAGYLSVLTLGLGYLFHELPLLVLTILQIYRQVDYVDLLTKVCPEPGPQTFELLKFMIQEARRRGQGDHCGMLFDRIATWEYVACDEECSDEDVANLISILNWLEAELLKQNLRPNYRLILDNASLAETTNYGSVIINWAKAALTNSPRTSGGS